MAGGVSILCGVIFLVVFFGVLAVYGRETVEDNRKWKRENSEKTLLDKARKLLAGGEKTVVVAFRPPPGESWESIRSPQGENEVKAARYCVLTGNGLQTWDALPEKLQGTGLRELSQKCKFVYAEEYGFLIRDGWGTWNFVRQGEAVALVWKLTGHGEKERREREEKRRQEDLFQSACMD